MVDCHCTDQHYCGCLGRFAEEDGRKVVGTIDLTPQWAAAMPILIAAIEEGTPEGKRLAKEELMDLARRLDER